MTRIAITLLILLSANLSFADTVLITGSNRGIGLEFAKQYAEAGWDVVATARKPKKAEKLNALAKKHPKLKIMKLDVADPGSVAKLAKKLKGQPIDVLINNAGILGDYEKQKLGQFDFDALDKVIEVNTKGPLRVTLALLDNVRASKQKKVVTLASALGSIAIAPRIPEMYWYKISKAGMSVAMASLNAQLGDEGITVLRLGPGMVNTRLLAQSGAGGQGIETKESVEGMRAVIEKATPRMALQTQNYNGKVIKD